MTGRQTPAPGSDAWSTWLYHLAQAWMSIKDEKNGPHSIHPAMSEAEVVATTAANDIAVNNAGTDTNEVDLDYRPFHDDLRFFALGTCVVLGFTVLYFGFAVYMGWTDDMAPRIANRPKNVLKSAMLYHLPQWMKQSPMWYPIAWIFWAYHLTYREGLRGIPGTGTRNNGFEGPLLKWNLDSVILLRFFTLMFKVSALVGFLCLILIPVYWTADCDEQTFGEGTCTQVENVTDVRRKMTFYNIPPKINNTNINITANETIRTNDLLLFLRGANGTELYTGVESLEDDLWIPGQTPRIMVLLISCVLIYLYTFYLLTLEWIENIDLRRTYFLEASHYSRRMVELNKLSLEFQRDASLADFNDTEHCLESIDTRAACLKQERDEAMARPAYLTHPEIRETPPSIGTFSVMYKLPNSLVTYETDGKSTLERQLIATANFFDEIISPEDGFSSSVAAVTMLPNAKLLKKARKKWADCEKLIHKLRYIRKRLRIIEKRQKENERKAGKGQDHLLAATTIPPEQEEPSIIEGLVIQTNHGGDRSNRSGSTDYDSEISTNNFAEALGGRISPDGSIHSISQEQEIESTEEGSAGGININSNEAPPSPLSSAGERGSNNKAAVFKYDDFNILEYATSIGFHEEAHDMDEFMKDMGIEEFQVFAYQCALLANGPGIKKSIFRCKTLQQQEKDTLKELRKANDELIEFRKTIAMVEDDDEELDPSEATSQPMLVDQNKEDANEDYGDHELSSGPFLEFIFPVRAFLRRVCRGKGKINDESRVQRKFYGRIPPDQETNSSRVFETNVKRPSYAVITFTSRHAAIIARHCLADGGARNRWRMIDEIPIYPLADGAPWDVMRPVSPTILYASKRLRRWIIYIFLVVFTVTNTYIVRQINHLLVETEWLENLSFSTALSGASQALLFSICPIIFTIISNMEGSSTSVTKAKEKATIFYWYFYVIARFMGQIVWDIAGNIWNGLGIERATLIGVETLAKDGFALGNSAFSVIIFYFTISFPIFYFLQGNNIATTVFRLRSINRLLKGGGPGTEIPYRIYVDSGYIFACMTALAPIYPFIGPFAFLNFVVIAPMLRWSLVFGFRNRSDGGGNMWPILHHIIVSSLILGQVMTAAVLVLKKNMLEGIVIAFCTIPTLLYNKYLLDTYLRPYKDASLLQTRRMYFQTDGPSSSTNNLLPSSRSNLLKSILEREEYRRWLVDCHKASYLPTCLSGDGSKNILTVEPAAVISDQKASTKQAVEDRPRGLEKEEMSMRNVLKRQRTQRGVILHPQQLTPTWNRARFGATP